MGLTSNQVGEALLPALMAELERQKPPPYPSQGLIQRSFKLTATFRRDRAGKYHVLGVQAVPLPTVPLGGIRAEAQGHPPAE
jgi:hypothetical protein